MDIPWEVHEVHVTDHEPRTIGPTVERSEGPLGLPIGFDGAAERWQRSGRFDAIELEPGVAGVHVEVDAKLASGSDHRLRERLRIELGAVEVSNEILAGQANPGANRVGLVLPAGRSSPPPNAPERIEPLVEHERGHVLA